VLAIHAAFMLAGFAGFTIAGCMAGLYLWEERRLKRRDSGVLRVRLPPLQVLDRLSARLAGAGLALLTVGIVVGLTTLEWSDVDAAMAVTACIWALYALVLLLRREGELRGRRAAWSLVTGLSLVAVVLPLTHFAA
jgi:ABC-type uncharacterized transport system permease subunit